MVEDILINTAEQLVTFVGIVFAVGFVISILNRVFYSIVGSNRALIYITGAIGTPIHELSHALMCILFGHRITEVKLFQMNSADGTMGYVSHTSNSRNLYQQIGHYFIGVAPILVSSVLLFVVLKHCIPSAYKEIEITFEYLADEKAFSWMLEFDAHFVDIMDAFFSNIGENAFGWVFLLLSMCVALHMNLSYSDIQSSLRSLPLIAVILAVVNFALGLISSSAYSDFLEVMSCGGLFVALMLSLALIISVLYVLVALAVKLVVSFLPGR